MSVKNLFLFLLHHHKQNCHISLFLFLLFCLFEAQAIPKRGNQPWTVILCKFKDYPAEPRGSKYFQSWLTDLVKEGSILRYFGQVSNGLYTIFGSNVVGWYVLPYTKAEVHGLAWKDENLKSLGDKKLQIFYKIKELCLKEARNQRAKLHKNTISVINDEETAVFCKENGVLLTPKFLLSAALAHEMTHSFFIGHSYSDNPVKIFPYSSPGEYDDKYDLMSTANAYMYGTTFGVSGPGLNGAHLDYLGWLPANRVYYFGKRGLNHEILRLSSLSVPHKESDNYLLILIPYDRDNPQNVYTVEYRTPTGVDQGIGDSAVVMHKVRRRKGHFFSYLVTGKKNFYELQQGSEWKIHIDGDQFVKVKVETIDKKFGFADLRIYSTFDPTRCYTTEVPRGIIPADPVCVSPQEKERIQKNNRLSRSRADSHGNFKQF